MSLTTRLTAFFLAVLAVVLIGFGTTTYTFSRRDLYFDAAEQINFVLKTLESAAQIRPMGVGWEPPFLFVSVGVRDLKHNQVEWGVYSPHGKRIVSTAHFQDLEGADDFPRVVDSQENQLTYFEDSGGRSWMFMKHQIAPKPNTARETSLQKMDGLIVAVAVSLEPINNTLSRLAVMLFVVSTIVWLAFLVIGRRICQRALRPVTRMSEQAGRMNEQRMNERLVVPEADDELRSLGVSFNGLLTRLQEAFERNRQFAGNASHQLRTPLAAIMGQVEVSLRHPRSAEEYRDTLVKVKNGGLQLRQIIESLLFLTRADREGLAAGFEPLDVSVWIETWRQQRDYLPRIHDLKIIRPDLPCWVRAQPALLAQMIDNLVDNASKYSPERTPILLQVIRLSKQVSISVENHAKGIPAEEIGYVFDPFFRSEDSRRSSIPGVGLGLAVVRRIAEAFQAEVRVESILNKTTKFEILLPRVPDEYSSKEARQDVLPALEEKVVSA